VLGQTRGRIWTLTRVTEEKYGNLTLWKQDFTADFSLLKRGPRAQSVVAVMDAYALKHIHSMLSDVSTINLEKGWPGKPLLMQDSSKLSFGLFFFHSLPRVPIFRRASPTLLWLDF
jgi:hypothetical protein